MPRFALIALALSTLLCAPCGASPAPAQIISELPFAFEKGHVIVQAKIKDKMPVEVILATGAEYSLLDFGMLEKYKLPAFYTGEGIITGGPQDRVYSFSTVPDIRVGDVKVTSLSMRLSSLAEISKRVGREIFGLLGNDFFRGRVVQFDFQKKVVRFLARSEAGGSKDNKTGADADGLIRLPIVFYKERLTLPVVENVTFNGKKVKMLLDTATVAVISMSASAAKQVGLSTPPEKSAPRADSVASLRLAEYEMKDVPILIYPRGADIDHNQKEFGAIAGVGLLQNFVITFDFDKKVIILETF